MAYDVNTGSGKVFEGMEAPTYSTLAAIQGGMNAFDWGKKTAQAALSSANISGLYRKSAQAGQPVTMEQIRDVYATVGDQDGLARMNDKIQQRDKTMADAQLEVGLQQIKGAISSQDPNTNKIIKTVMGNLNANRAVASTYGGFNYDEVSQTFSRPAKPGEKIKLPDGTDYVADQGDMYTYKIDPTGRVVPTGIDNSKSVKLAQAQSRAQNQDFRNVMSLRKEYNALPTIKAYQELGRQRTVMESTYDEYLKNKNKSSLQAMDQAIIMTYNKIMDPTSVVRESEYARTPEGLSLMNRMSAYGDKIKRGGAGLTDEERRRIIEMAKAIHAGVEKNAIDTAKNYAEESEYLGVPADRIVGNYMQGLLKTEVQLPPTITANEKTYILQPNGKYIEQTQPVDGVQ